MAALSNAVARADNLSFQALPLKWQRMYFLYSIALAITLLVTAPWWLLAMVHHGKYRAGLWERLGRVPARLSMLEKRGEKEAGASRRACIWVHAVSVGEVLAISGLIADLRQRFPRQRIVVSTTTSTGQKLARDRFGEDNVFYFPADFGFAIRPYLRQLRPSLIVLAETEFWPNFLRLVRADGALVTVVNARISDRSFPRYHRFRFITRRVLRNVDLFLAQSSEDARRLMEIGAIADRVQVSGNLKFDVAPPAQAPFAAKLKRQLDAADAFPVLVCGSTVEPEEMALLGTFQIILKSHPNAVMVLAPRRPERFDEVARLAESFAVRCWRRSQLPDSTVLRGGLLLLDSIGELASVYSVGTLALVGGSLAPRGGHNILEPAYFGVPILVGPHTRNFRDIISIFRARDAVRVVRAFREGNTKGDLTKTILDLIQDTAAREALGRNARETLQSQAGATARTIDALQRLIMEKDSREVPLSTTR
jgi:3-deoxy-D-manno-octulosonic-acid transferase